MAAGIAGVGGWVLYVAMVAAQIALVGLAFIVAFEGRKARPWMFLALLVTVAVAIAEIVIGIDRWNTFIELSPAVYLPVALLIGAAPVVLLWGFVSSRRRRTALWQALGGSLLSLLVLGVVLFAYVGDG